MSFMLVEGKMCVCKKCNDITLARYTEGPQFTQIGDAGVWQQEQLAKKYGTTDNPILSRFYIVKADCAKSVLIKLMWNPKFSIIGKKHGQLKDKLPNRIG